MFEFHSTIKVVAITNSTSAEINLYKHPLGRIIEETRAEVELEQNFTS